MDAYEMVCAANVKLTAEVERLQESRRTLARQADQTCDALAAERAEIKEEAKGEISQLEMERDYYRAELATMTAERDALRLTGNENAVNCDGLPATPHTPVAIIRGTPCPACAAQAALDTLATGNLAAQQAAARALIRQAAEVERLRDELAVIKAEPPCALRRVAIARVLLLPHSCQGCPDHECWQSTRNGCAEYAAALTSAAQLHKERK